MSQALQALKIDPERIRIGVIRSSEAPAPGNASSPSTDDSRVDIYLTDSLAEKFSHK